MDRIISDSNLKKSMLINTIFKPISYIISFLYTPFLLSYLGNEKYGLWATILSIVGWINFCDIGIGNSLRNVLTKELKDGEYSEVRKSVSTAYSILSIIAISLVFMVVFISRFIEWNQFFNTSFEINSVIVISFSTVALNFVLGLGKIILFSMQFSERVSLIELFSGILQFAGLIILIKVSRQNLILVALILGLSSCLIYLTNDVVLAVKCPHFKPSLKFFDKSKAKILFSGGFLFLILQLGGIAMNSTDNFLVSHYYGNEAVTPYNTTARMFSAAYAVYLAFISPVWAKVAYEKEKRNFKWIGHMTLNLSGVMVLMSVFFVILGFFYKPIAAFWLQKELTYEKGLIAVTTASVIFEMMTATFSSILNGLDILKIQASIAIIHVITNIPLSILFAKTFDMGPVGVKLSTMLLFMSSAIVYAVVLYIYIRRKQKDVDL